MAKRLVAVLGAACLAWGAVPPAHAAPAPDQLRPKKTSVTPGKTVKLTAALRTKAVRPVQLQRKSGKLWTRVLDTQTNRRGRAVIRIEAARYDSRFAYRVVAPRHRVAGKRLPRLVTNKVTVQVTSPVLTPGSPGSIEAPLPPGQPFRSGDWTIALGVTDTDAWPEIAAANVNNTAPAPAWAYLTVPVTVTNNGETKASAWLDTQVLFLGGDGKLYERTGWGGDCGVVPNSLTMLPKTKPGKTATGVECAAVRVAAIPGGHWVIRGNYWAPSTFVTPAPPVS